MLSDSSILSVRVECFEGSTLVRLQNLAIAPDSGPRRLGAWGHDSSPTCRPGFQGPRGPRVTED